MKLVLSLSLVITILGCGPNASEVAEQIRIKDSIAVAHADSIRMAAKIEELRVKYVAVDSTKNEIQKNFDATLFRLDSWTGRKAKW
jgi:hypothetical protein